MHTPDNRFNRTLYQHVLLSAGALALLGGCGANGGTDAGLQSAAPVASAALASGTSTFQLAADGLPAGVAQQAAQPFFHVAPVLLDAPEDADAFAPDAQARMAPRQQRVPGEFAQMSSRRLTVHALRAARQARSLAALAPDAGVAPLFTPKFVATYSPSQIRAAYGLPALPAAGSSLSASLAASLGAGQTIYIVDAMHDPNAGAELAAFNQKFALPTCATKAIASGASLPLAPANASACEFSVVYNTNAGALSANAPAFDAGWATEIALDVQWAHATAPLARIVLIEAASASLDSLVGAIKLANAMGPGVVSMSFGSDEGSWTASTDAAFGAPNMSYLAATGDNGASVQWPAVSPKVLAVGGTSLNYSGTGSRSETGWSGTGGGTSAYTATPSYQNNTVPGLGNVAHRTVADVAFNADPSTGQYVAVLSPGSSAVSWVSVGGTSLSTPQWAGILAVANATRALTGKAALGTPHALLYGQIASVPGKYASNFADITQGSDGSCASCSAKAGYDQLSGLGTPNVASLLGALNDGTSAATAPLVTPASISGKVGTALSFTVSVQAPNPVTYTLTGAPAGMSISGAGAVSWATPLAGSYPVTVIAKDTKTALSGQGVYTVVISALAPPVLTPGAISGKVGTALSYNVVFSAPNPVSFTLGGAPAGMTISSGGTLSWATPVQGTYTVTVTAKDSKTALTGQAAFTIAIGAVAAPVVTPATINGSVGSALAFTVASTAPNPVAYTLSGAPTGMSISGALVSWARPVAGTYAVTVIAKDSKTGLSGQAVLTVKIVSGGPTITAAPINGVAGKPVSGTISVASAGAAGMSVSLSGVPMGMTFSAAGSTLTANWANPVQGNYSMKVILIDSFGQSAQTTIPITIAAR